LIVYVLFSLSVHWLPILGSMVCVFFVCFFLFFNLFGIFRALLLDPNTPVLLFIDCMIVSNVAHYLELVCDVGCSRTVIFMS